MIICLNLKCIPITCYLVIEYKYISFDVFFFVEHEIGKYIDHFVPRVKKPSDLVTDFNVVKVESSVFFSSSFAREVFYQMILEL